MPGLRLVLGAPVRIGETRERVGGNWKMDVGGQGLMMVGTEGDAEVNSALQISEHMFAVVEMASRWIGGIFG